jgi:adenine-specific DNA glycosylase
VITARRFVAAVARRSGRMLVRQRPAGVVNAHLWEFPNLEVSLNATKAAVQEAIEKELGCEVRAFDSIVTIKHSITRYRITLEAYRVEFNGTAPDPFAGTWKTPAAIEALALTSAHRKIALRLKRN